jgi:type VI secretion system protein
MLRCVLACCLTLLLPGALAGCGVSKGLAKRATRVARVSSGKMSLQVAISPDANQNSPVAVDVLLIKDKSLLKAAQGMSAKDWFAKKRQLTNQYPKAVEVQSWEWIPGQTIGPISFVVPVDVEGAMMFARYASDGPHSLPLPTSGKVAVCLGSEDLKINSNCLDADETVSR